MKRTVCMLLALLLLGAVAFAAVSCGDKDEESSGAESNVSKSDEALVPHLGKADYSGKVLRVLTTSEAYKFGKTVFGVVAEETEAEAVAEACVNRDALIAQEYGFTIETEFVEDFNPFTEKVEDDMLTNMVDYDLVSSGLQSMAGLAKEGYFLDLKTIEGSHLCLDKDWWDVAADEDMTIMDKLFFATGDIQVLDDEYTRCIFYNKGLAEDHQLESPAELVYENKWTLDKMYEMAAECASEMDDGQMTVLGEDVWGIVCDAFDLYSLVLGCNCPQVEKDQDDLPVMAMLEERNVRAFEKAWEIIKDDSVTAYTELFYKWNDADAHLVKDQFYNGKSLFLVSTVNAVNSEKLREANIRYGILPMAMYDDTQEGYATTVDPYHFYVVSVMNTCKDLDFVTFAMETLAYVNKQFVTPQYYDVTLKTKRFPDDDDSPQMLDIIFSNRLVDISVAFNWDDCIQYYNQTIWGAVSPQLASVLEARLPVFEAEMQQTLDLFRNMK